MSPDKVVKLDGCSLHYADSQGSGRAVVFLHAAGADHQMFAAPASALSARGFRTVLPDLRGHGLSRPNQARLTADRLVDDVETLIGRLQLDRPILVGLSLGGNIAQRLVRRRPERYAALAVLDSTWNDGPLTAIERIGVRAVGPGIRAIPAKRLPSVMARASAVTPAARADLVRAFCLLSKAEFRQVLVATTRFVRPDPGYRTPVPLLLIRGAQDRTGNISTAMPRWARAEGVPEHIIDDAGHVVTLDAPAVVTDLLADFVAGL